ncbi:ShlB/FhaC/HecB family hemolysin secretion/activation protein [Sphingobium boeckii]|uniref:Hemolysin activation/secretion protein n=1 Tax=Sphingobium boeckii TaxID=1082345 RepID=A0A7W9EE62_9SPHN|nr:ShlB/FhaC/HecB family hemolysin secretion/activation protein [Sphingobium boeckii]MBB5685847.1 hemolysin activation/secretion protein [Sphingobium boeckii]
MVSPRFGRYTLLAALCATASPAILAAQTPPTREEIERGRINPNDPRPRTRLSVEGGIERAPCPLADPRFAAINVTIADVQFDGLKGLAPADLRAAWAPYAGRSVPVSTVCEIRDSAATILRQAGYLAAVQVPPQRIEADGVVRFDVLMAKMVGIQVRGDAGRSEQLIAGYLEAIKDQDVFNIKDAERYLLLARDLPGYDVRLTLRPAGTVPGEVIGEVAVLHTPVEIDVNVQNYGSKDVGRFGGLARVQFNGLTGMGDSTSVSVFSTSDFKEQQVLQLGHVFRVGREGLTFSGDFTYAWTKPDVGGPSPFRSETLSASARASYPIIRSQARNLFGSIGFDYVDQQVRFGGLPITEDNLRVAFARIDFDSLDGNSIASTQGYSANEPRWRFGLSAEARQGLSVFGASKPCGTGFVRCNPPFTALSKVEADPTAFVARLSGYGEFRPLPNIAFSLAPRAQYAPKALLSYEEFSAGTYTVGRGFDPGTIIGDTGVGFAAEVKFGSLIPRRADAIAFQPFAFFDAAWVWNEDSQFDGLDPQKLYSAGGGLRAAWGDHGRLDIVGAVPLNTAGFQTKRGDVRLLASITMKLLPWNR